MLLEQVYFFVGQRAGLTDRELAEHDRTLAHADQPQHIVAKQLGDLADLAFAALVDHDADPHAIVDALGHIDPRRGGGDAIELDASAPLAQRIGGRCIVEECAVLLFDIVAGVGQPLGQLAVIGEQQQPLAIVVQPADREQAGL